MVPHTSDDDDRRYRSARIWRVEVKDPITRFSRMEEHGVLDAKAGDEIAKRVAEEVDAATEYAEKAAPPEPESALRHVFAEEEGK
jgi:2-oxoisovalerate dehydrogenase E1 component alpha subunit